ncbi:MAG: hypothetical protein ACI9SC_001944 [Gammaproteobacteria bacterium]|jgi:hypothetical protein
MGLDNLIGKVSKKLIQMHQLLDDSCPLPNEIFQMRM